MLKILATLLAASAVLALAPPAVADGGEVRDYVASAGVSVMGIGAASNNAAMGPGRFTSPHAHNSFRVEAFDDAGSTPYITACVDVNANNLCTSSDGDLQFTGYGSVGATTTSSFTNIVVFLYAVAVDGNGDLHLGTTGIVTVTWG